MRTPVFRFAPSPNGYLHLGHALAALTDFEMARALSGRFLLRIEDIDATRCRPEFEQAIYEDLAWLGIAWEEPVRRQSEHLDAYRDALAKLGGPRLSELREPRRDRAPGRGARRQGTLAARSGRRAALSRQCEATERGGTRAPGWRTSPTRCGST